MEGVLFTPPSGGRRYKPGVSPSRHLLVIIGCQTTATQQDFIRLCEQQPILLHDLPAYLSDPYINPAYIKPKLWLGWYLDDDALFAIVEKHFPEFVRRDFKGVIDKRGSSIHLPSLLKLRLQIPDDFADLVDIVEAGLPDPKDKRYWVISVGNNRKGYIRQDYLEGIRKIMGGETEEDPKWYLCKYDWKWKRERHSGFCVSRFGNLTFFQEGHPYPPRIGTCIQLALLLSRLMLDYHVLFLRL